MKIYEKPSVEIKRFDVEDVMFVSSAFDATDYSAFQDITGQPTSTVYSGVAFQW